MPYTLYDMQKHSQDALRHSARIIRPDTSKPFSLETVRRAASSLGTPKTPVQLV